MTSWWMRACKIDGLRKKMTWLERMKKVFRWFCSKSCHSNLNNHFLILLYVHSMPETFDHQHICDRELLYLQYYYSFDNIYIPGHIENVVCYIHGLDILYNHHPVSHVSPTYLRKLSQFKWYALGDKRA